MTLSKTDHFKEVEKLLNRQGYSVSFTKDSFNIDDYPINESNYVTITNNDTFKSKTIKILKNYKRMNLEYLMNKIHPKSVYKGIYKLVYKFLLDNGYNRVAVYPTSYGIGIDTFCSDKEFDKRKDIIKDLLDKYGLIYTVEYSDAGWVYRYRFSQSKENLNRLRNINK